MKLAKVAGRALKSKNKVKAVDSILGERVKTVFRKGAKLWRDNTCIDIYEDTCGDSEILVGENRGPNIPNLGYSLDRIRVVMEGRCWSNVGREGGEQKLSLGDGCDTVYTAVHELGHSLGLFHTHTRHDRKQFLRVNRQNIDAINYNYGLPLDFGSIMIYESTADSNYIYTLGSPFLSFYDIQMLNLHYNCTDSSAVCKNGGFAHPRDCTRCICPGGYGGRLCDERVSNSLHYALSNKYAPLGKKIEVTLLSFSPNFVAVSGCKYDGVEIKTQADQRLTDIFDFRFSVNTVLVSNSSMVPIITYNSLFQSSIEIHGTNATENDDEGDQRYDNLNSNSLLVILLLAELN
ncbi:unnamed protein product [Heligmosomoides polygyrus]|uniref:Metalloendopeptidase n=1 Tax=Heligmosomoides polygyrus TaxID=6339 RepID=A0A183G1C7_HELPZ|nr:unnamed protein product [Heligmosomoides polygyrus]